MCWSTKVPALLCSFRNALPWDNFAYKITANSIINTNKYNGIKYKSTCDSNGYTWWQKPSLNKYHIASFIQLNTNTKNRTMPHYDDNERWLPDGKSHHLDRKAKRLRLHPVLHLSQHCMINVMHIWQAWCIFDKYDAFYQFLFKSTTGSTSFILAQFVWHLIDCRSEPNLFVFVVHLETLSYDAIRGNILSNLEK